MRRYARVTRLKLLAQDPQNTPSARRNTRNTVLRKGLAATKLASVLDIQVFTPAQVAERLGITTAALRRLAPHYERIFEELPRDARQGRMWTSEAVTRLEQARQMFQAGQVVSIEVALEHLAAGGEPTEAVVQRREEAQDPLERLIEEVRRLREAVEAQNVRLDRQREGLRELAEENRQLRMQLPAPRPEPEQEPSPPLPRRRGFWVWLRRR